MKKTLLEEILVTEPDARAEPQTIAGVVVGRLVGLGPAGEPMVDYPGNEAGHPVPAGATTGYNDRDVGREVALLFENGDAGRPLVIGPLIRPETPPQPGTEVQDPKTMAVSVDGECVTFTAEKEIVLRCGAASITLTRAGKILIRGKYVLSRSSGVNRIKGGSIQLN